VISWKENPVTLVKIVVARKSSVKPLNRRSVSMPSSTTTPEAIPMRLMMTCTVVNVDNDIPKIMTRILSRMAGRQDTRLDMRTKDDTHSKCNGYNVDRNIGSRLVIS
jgi:hypothetical protein